MTSASEAEPAERSRLRVADSDVLVVDDIEWNRALIGTLLEEAGYTNIRYAVDGQDALDRIAEQVPDLVILDIMMPGIDGFEVCRRLRANNSYADLPVLVQTALSGVEDRNRAFEAGTTDLVTKPLDRVELLARVTIHLENRALIRDLLQYRDRLEDELAMARKIFQHLMPSGATLERLRRESGMAFDSHMVRATDLGGDIWGTVGLSDGRVGVYLLDLAGRGVSAALNVCRLHTLVQELTGLAESPAAFLAALNRRTHDLMFVGEHASMIYGVVSPAEQRLSYACAGASPPLVLLPGGVTPQIGNAAGLPLGVTADAVYQTQELPFPAGAAILLYSNAILDALDSEAPGTDGADELGAPQGLVALIEQVRPDNDSIPTFPTITELLDRVVGNPPKDDHTLVWLSR
jgi:sigma-B regulation protein RsbU (phosphoserine phosphatase)